MPTLELNSYIGVGSLKFSMREDEILPILGKPTSIQNNWLNEKTFTYNSFELVFSLKDEKLVEISFQNNLHFIVNGLSIFDDMAALEKLLAQEENPLEYVGILFLPSLGLTLSGFHTEDDKVATAICKGRLDSMLPKFKAFRK